MRALRIERRANSIVADTPASPKHDAAPRTHCTAPVSGPRWSTGADAPKRDPNDLTDPNVLATSLMQQLPDTDNHARGNHADMSHVDLRCDACERAAHGSSRVTSPGNRDRSRRVRA